MKYILPYLRPYRRQTALAMVLVAFATVCDLLLPTIMNDILNHGVRQSDFAYIVRCCVWMLAVAAEDQLRRGRGLQRRSAHGRVFPRQQHDV